MTFTIVNRKNELFRVRIDNSDAEEVLCRKWHVSLCRGHLYVGCWYKGNRTYLHQLLVGKAKGFDVDHINGDGLDNRRRNLRLIPHRLNIVHTTAFARKKASKYKGVWWDRRGKRWRSEIRVKGKKYWVGSFDNEESAAIAWNIKARKLLGKFAGINPVAGKRVAK